MTRVLEFEYAYNYHSNRKIISDFNFFFHLGGIQIVSG